MRDTPKKTRVITLGCSKNTVDSEVLLKQLAENNCPIATDGEDSEIAIINTCGFIEAAKQESIETILQAVRLKEEGRLAKVIVMGCLSERYASELKKEIPEVDAFFGSNAIDRVVEAAGGKYKKELLGERMVTTPRHFAYLKISEGCDRPCSFCSIPIMRGKHVSKPAERVVLEARRLAALGVRELILIAQDSTYYGLDLYGKRSLARLLADLAGVEGIEWIRLMYAYPAGFPEDVIEQFATNPKLCPYIDLPLQHISDPVLMSMKRGITRERIHALLGRLRTSVPEMTIRTTLIVGYPNEGEEEFRELLDFVRAARFDRLGVFPYSLEDGTSAFALGDPILQEVKEARRGAIMAVQSEVSHENNRRLVGTVRRVLVDEVIAGGAIGRTVQDAPEIDNEVTIRTPDRLAAGEFTNVLITDAAEYDLFGVPAQVHSLRAQSQA